LDSTPEIEIQIDPDRLFIVASKLDAAGIKDKGRTSRTGLSLK
jgi:hypothetical protein